MPTLHVSKTATNGYGVGNDTTGDGSKASPYLTITKAFITAAANGDSILVNDGIYTESGFLNPTKTGLTLSPENDGAVTIKSANGADTRIIHRRGYFGLQ
jgi:hypothetical protein